MSLDSLPPADDRPQRQNSNEFSGHRLLTAREVAARMGIGLSTFYKLLAKNLLPVPALRIGRIVRWLEAEIDQFLSGSGPARNR